MTAFLLTLAIFTFWFLLGFAIVSALQSRRNILQNLLLAPAAGMSATVLAVFLLNRAGIPVGRFAHGLTVLLFAAAVVLLWRIRPVFPTRRYLPFAAALLLALFLAGWPLLMHGFEWVAYGNSDMVILSAAAQYFLNSGFFDGPNPEDLLRGRDYSQYVWYIYVVDMHRVGNEMLLGWVAALTRLRPDQIYMSLTLSVHLVLISSTAALTLQSRGLRLAALLAALLLALSPLSSQAVVNQLSSQVGGLAFLAACATLLLRPYRERRPRHVVRRAALAGLVAAATLLYYPEMAPFLALALALYLGLGLWRRELSWKPGLAFLGIAGFLCVAVLNTQVIAAFMQLYSAAKYGGAVNQGLASSLFPFFLKPVGLAILWGFQTFNNRWPEPLASMAILAGAVLLAAAVAATVWQAYRRTPVALISVVIFGLAIRFFITNSDFALFKLAFFIQPFMLATLAVAWLALMKRPVLRVAPLVALALTGLGAQAYYTLRSADLSDYSVEIWKGSKLRIKSDFQHVLDALPPGAVTLVDAPNSVLSGLQALAGRGRELAFTMDLHLSRISLATNEVTERVLPFHAVLRPELVRKLDEINAFENEQDPRRMMTARFDLHRPDPGDKNLFRAPRLPGSDNTWFIALTGKQSIFNRRKYGERSESSFAAFPLRDASNYLAFVNSELGNPYSLLRNESTSFYQLEPDHFFNGSTMSGVGRVFLFQVINPTRAPRMALEITASFKADGENQLPPASVVGNERLPFPLLGRGSARVFSDPVAPQWIEGSPFLSIDMNTAGRSFPSSETGLQTLYGSQLLLDRRQLVAFARDVSLVSDEEYRDLKPPEHVRDFPADLANPALEYSGVYEDGWVSEAAFFALAQPPGAARMRIEGMIPLIDDSAFGTEVDVLVDGRKALTRKLGLGDFKLEIALPPGATRRRVDLRFSKYQRLPHGDNRVAVARLKYIGF
jgi:hypothetical protein